MDDPYAGVTWHDAGTLGLRGQAWNDEVRDQPYDRFPVTMRDLVSPELWSLSTCAAGQYVDLRSTATDLFVRWRMGSTDKRESNMTDRARGGIDCYGRDHAGVWHWVGCCTPCDHSYGEGKINNLALDGGERIYRFYLPLMRQTLSLEVGARESIEAVTPDPRRPIAYYGTSIVHGSGVSRPGLSHAAQLGRLLDRDVFNLGFCGRAWCEQAVADALGRLDPCLFIVDVLPNNSDTELLERLPPFLRTVRAGQEQTSILLLGDRVFGDAAFMPQRDAAHRAKNRALDMVIDTLRQEGMTGLHVGFHEDWYGADGEGTTDASHPNDLGAWRMSRALMPIVRQIVG